MRVIELVDKRKTRIVELPDPVIKPGEVLIQTAYAGICGSDIHAFEGRHPFRKPPVVLGHEISGKVVAVGSRVSNFGVGDAVTVMPYKHCSECAACREGKTNVCRRKSVPGVNDWVGTFAELFASEEDITFRLNSDSELLLGALAEPLAVAVHAVKRARVSSNDGVLILGSGTIGILTAVAASWAGARTVAVTDVVDYNLDVGNRIVPISPVDASQRGFESELLERFPDGFSCVFMSSGVAVNVQQAFSLVATGGRIVVTGMYMERAATSYLDITLREVEVLGSQIYVAEDFAGALKIIASRRYPLDHLISDTVTMEETQEALMGLAERRIQAVKILVQPS